MAEKCTGGEYGINKRNGKEPAAAGSFVDEVNL
jgi:hypothetical protein